MAPDQGVMSQQHRDPGSVAARICGSRSLTSGWKIRGMLRHLIIIVETSHHHCLAQKGLVDSTA